MKIGTFLFVILFVVSCGGPTKVSDARVDAYKRAAEQVLVAESSEKLVEISYDLQNELAAIDDSVVSIDEMRRESLAGNDEYDAVLDSIKFYSERVSELLSENKATVKVLESADKWYGVTYAADKPQVVAALQAMAQEGKYPDGLWG